MSLTRHRAWLWAATILLVLFFLSRLYHLMILPLFLDEASHITRAQWVWQGKPFYLLETGKALAPYVAAIFWPFTAAPFIGRFVVVLFGAIGLASAYAVGRELHSRNVGLLCMAFWLICPQLMFFERMALVDTTLGSMGVLTLWLAIRMMRSRRIVTAVMCGIGLALCILAKLTGLVFLPIPILAAFLITSRTKWLIRFRQMAIAYAVFGILMAWPLYYIHSVNADPTGQSSGLTTTDTNPDTLGRRVEKNATSIWEAYQVYFSPAVFRVMVGVAIAALFFAPRRTLMLWLLAGAFLGVIIAAAAAVWLRYASTAVPFILLGAALGFVLLTEEAQRGFRFPRLVLGVPWLLALGWAILIGLPFQLTAYRDPTQLTLPATDRVEYIEWIPSGYGVREAAQYLQKNITAPITVVGTAVNCNGARLYMPLNTPVSFLCPDLDWGGHNQSVIDDIYKRVRQNGSIFVLAEDKVPPTVDVSALPEPRSELQTFSRPTGYYNVHLYRVGGEVAQTFDKP